MKTEISDKERGIENKGLSRGKKSEFPNDDTTSKKKTSGDKVAQVPAIRLGYYNSRAEAQDFWINNISKDHTVKGTPEIINKLILHIEKKWKYLIGDWLKEFEWNRSRLENDQFVHNVSEFSKKRVKIILECCLQENIEIILFSKFKERETEELKSIDAIKGNLKNEIIDSNRSIFKPISFSAEPKYKFQLDGADHLYRFDRESKRIVLFFGLDEFYSKIYTWDAKECFKMYKEINDSIKLRKGFSSMAKPEMYSSSSFSEEILGAFYKPFQWIEEAKLKSHPVYSKYPKYEYLDDPEYNE